MKLNNVKGNIEIIYIWWLSHISIAFTYVCIYLLSWKFYSFLFKVTPCNRVRIFRDVTHFRVSVYKCKSYLYKQKHWSWSVSWHIVTLWLKYPLLADAAQSFYTRIVGFTSLGMNLNVAVLWIAVISILTSLELQFWAIWT